MSTDKSIVFKISEIGPIEPSRSAWPFFDMNVGDAVWASDTPVPINAQKYAHVYGHQLDKKFRSKKAINPKTGKKDTVIWRVE